MNLLVDAPAAPTAALVLGHGAGAGMAHPFLAATAAGLAARGVAVLRYQFPFIDAGATRVDPPPVAHATVRAAVAAARDRWPALPLFAGGKSWGGRMTSQTQAAEPLAGVLGIVFFGFPLHPAGKPSAARAEHLAQTRCPLLFAQGTRDALADAALLQAAIDGLGARAALHWEDGADHAFHVRRDSGRRDADVLAGTLDAVVRWMAATAAGTGLS